MFSDKLKNITVNFTKFSGNKKALTLVAVVGCIGILLIGASDWLFSKNETVANGSGKETSVEEYIETLEKKAQQMILSIDGAGKSKIMVTAESSSEKQYATDNEISNDYKSNQSEQDEKNELKSEIVIIESGGDESALVTTVTQPQIRGVLVLCEGADTPKVKENVTEAIKTIFGVPYNKICVIKLKT